MRRRSFAYAHVTAMRAAHQHAPCKRTLARACACMRSSNRACEQLARASPHAYTCAFVHATFPLPKHTHAQARNRARVACALSARVVAFDGQSVVFARRTVAFA
eukprot:6198497-Pleurochrysis_carterae.AAC.1